MAENSPSFVCSIGILAIGILVLGSAPVLADGTTDDSPSPLHAGQGDTPADPLTLVGVTGSVHPDYRTSMANVIDAVLDELGQSANFVEMPRRDAALTIVEGQVDGGFGWEPTSEGMIRFHYSDPIALVPKVVVSDAYVALSSEHPNALSGRTMCAPAGTSPPDNIRALADQGAITVQPANDLATCAHLIHDGRSDFFVAGATAGRTVLEEMDMLDEFHLDMETPVGVQTLHLVTARADPNGRDLIRRFDRALEALIRNGSLDPILPITNPSLAPDR